MADTPERPRRSPETPRRVVPHLALGLEREAGETR